MISGVNFSNSSLSDTTRPGQLLNYVAIVYGIVASIAGVGFIINLITIMMILIRDKVKNASDGLDLHLAFCNMIVAVIVVIYTSMALANSSIGLPYQIMESICKAFLTFSPTSYVLAVATMTLMSVERYRAVIHPMKPRMSGKKVLVILITVWITSVAIAVACMFESRADPSNTSVCIFGQDERRFIIAIAMGYYSVAGYFIPVIVMLYCYTKIVTKLKILASITERHSIQDSTNQTRKKRVIKTMIIVSSIFTCTGMPFVIALIINIVAVARGFDYNSFERDIETGLASAAAILLVSATTYNPVIYFVKNSARCNLSYYNRVQAISKSTKSSSSNGTSTVKRKHNTFST